MSCTSLWRCNMVTWNHVRSGRFHRCSKNSLQTYQRMISWWVSIGPWAWFRRSVECGLMSTYQNPRRRLTSWPLRSLQTLLPTTSVGTKTGNFWKQIPLHLGAMLAIVRKLQAIKAASQETQRLGTLWWKGFDGIWWLLMSFQLMISVYPVMAIPKFILSVLFMAEPWNCWNLWDLNPSNLRLAFVAKLQEMPLVPPLETQLLHYQWCDFMFVAAKLATLPQERGW